PPDWPPAAGITGVIFTTGSLVGLPGAEPGDPLGALPADPPSLPPDGAGLLPPVPGVPGALPLPELPPAGGWVDGLPGAVPGAPAGAAGLPPLAGGWVAGPVAGAEGDPAGDPPL